jgi:hypothetical protein
MVSQTPILFGSLPEAVATQAMATMSLSSSPDMTPEAPVAAIERMRGEIDELRASLSAARAAVHTTPVTLSGADTFSSTLPDVSAQLRDSVCTHASSARSVPSLPLGGFTLGSVPIATSIAGSTISSLPSATRPASSLLPPPDNRPFSDRPLPMPDKFSGKGQMTVDAWLLDMELWLQASNINPTKFVTYGLFNLVGDARRFVVEQNKTLNLTAVSWEEFQRFLIKAYAKPLTRKKIRSALSELRQGEMTVLQLTRELKRCIGALPYDLDEYEHIHHFLNALNEPLRTMCSTRPDGLEWSSIEALVTHALNREATFRPLPPPPGTMVFTPNSGEGVSAKFTSALKPKGGGVAKKAKRSSDLTYFGNTKDEQARMKAARACFRCGQTGHAFGPVCPEFESGLLGQVSLAGKHPKGPLRAASFQPK